MSINDLLGNDLRSLAVGDACCFSRWSTIHGTAFHSKVMRVTKVTALKIIMDDGTEWNHKGYEWGSGKEDKYARHTNRNKRSLHKVLDVAAYTLYLKEEERLILERRRREGVISELKELVTGRDVLIGVPVENIQQAVKLLKNDNNSAALSAQRDGTTG